jgi:uncharacterized protein (TIGR00369 family)
MQKKTTWQNRLDMIVEGKVEKPEIVNLMRLPDIDEWALGKIKTHWQVDEAFFSIGGSLFGGYIASLADQVLSHTTLTILDEDKFFRTISLDVEFYKPIKKGILNITGIVVHKSKTRVHCQVTFEQNDKLMAQAKGIQQLV